MHLDWPPVLRLLTTRESGKAYYATVGIEVSAAVRCAAAAFKYKYQTRRDRCFPWLLFVSRALLLRYAILTRWLLSAAPSLEKAYSRMALLLTPGRFIQLCNGLRVEARPKNAFLNGASLLQAGFLSNRVMQRPKTRVASTTGIRVIGGRTCQRWAAGAGHRGRCGVEPLPA